MFAGKKFYAVIAAALAMTAGGVTYGYMEHAKKQTAFFGDGYVLTLDESTGETLPEPVYFNAGTKYKVSYPEPEPDTPMYTIQKRNPTICTRQPNCWIRNRQFR